MSGDASRADGNVDGNVRAAEVVLACADVNETARFFAGLGFRVDAIAPADDPATALLGGHGLRIRLERGAAGPPGLLRLLCRDPSAVAGGATVLVAPGGTRVELAPADPPLALPPLAPSLVIARAGGAAWHEGRAGMLYRDLIPDRQGGRFVASHIRIPDGGPVPDYVHCHRIRFQLIYCHRGWVRVVYEDQGPPFVLAAGDAVLQPPLIRHRVLESSPGLEVVELSSPAEHETLADHDLALPTGRVDAGRDFGGQRFVHHRAAGAAHLPWRDGLAARDLGIAAATAGLASAHVARPLARRGGAAAAERRLHGGELCFLFVLAGGVTLDLDQDAHRLAASDAAAVPGDVAHALVDPSPDLELLEIALPAAGASPPGPPYSGVTNFETRRM
ncbi:MAG TPA: hypothetical protein VKB80_08200 [Kofleriaceae bacterium]|nr:hypothetical protein [Kofleriaceae bacterium]